MCPVTNCGNYDLNYDCYKFLFQIKLVNQIHWMGGSVRKNIMNSKVTHLICEKIPRLTREEDERRKINTYK